ncbi:hypothetical protein Ancab_028438 [Ancistrocladus abbreviatus]
MKFPEPSSKLSDVEWSLQTLSIVAPGQGTANLVRMGALAGMTRLGLSDSSSSADWSLLADLQASQINDSDILRRMESNWFPTSLIKVTLGRTKLDSTQFENFGKLPNLRIFKLCKAWGHLMFQKDLFPMIQAFSMVDVTIQSWKLEEGALPYLEHLIFDNCNFNGELPHKALAALAYLRSIRAKTPMGERLDSLATLEGMVKYKCSIVIIPKQWRKFLKNPGNA